ncbi:saccharopine dehydrogenase family protein [Methylotenera sp. L2L1]|uniref:saccharopine dehydrogenase family protein n=1 Tax=Methylotenera sp. L2L1 TaxID=1502770 RepID=UPI000563BCA8|nr:saccharopine dehydrogenase NADP-binding domain-containing protein [Methylotenera sp. L2L1]
MIQRVLIIGGYGNFGSVISRTLAKESDIQIIVAGRSLQKAETFTQALDAKNIAEAIFIDINQNIATVLSNIKPNILIHTSGPFQGQSYDVAKACIQAGINYIDLADGRNFVEGIGSLNSLAKEANVLLISGASSVPCLTSALIDHYYDEFEALDSLDYGITTAQKTTRGLATTAAILGYTGKSFQTIINGVQTKVYGWQGLTVRRYKNLGWRLLGYCDVPDLALFPKRYPSLKNIRFYAGLELPFIHVVLWGLSWLVRLGVIKHLEKFAPLMLRLSFMFDWVGSSNSAFHMSLSGRDVNGGANKTITFELLARSGDGPNIPCIPAIIIAKKLAKNEIDQCGAFPCIGFISRDEYLGELKSFDISWQES